MPVVAEDKADADAAGAPETQQDPAAPAPSVISVLVVDDHALLREGLKQAIARAPGLNVVGEATNGVEALASARTLRPDVILMDVTMPVMGGMEATSVIVAELPGTRVIGLSMHAEEEVAARMIAAGAETYFTKGAPIGALLTAIHGRVD